MASPGRKRTISDIEILLHFANSPDPAFLASEFTEDFGMSRQGVLNRLDDLEEKGMLRSKKASGRRLFWITHDGLQEVSQAELQLESGEESN